MKIFSVEQIRRLDSYTIEHEPIPSIELMERAARTFVRWFAKKFPVSHFNKIVVVCGPGNNGGDGLAIARMLSREFYAVQAYLLRIGKELSDDCHANLKTLKKYRTCPLEEIGKDDPLPDIPPGCVLIDAIFGSGLSRPVEGWTAKLIAHLNSLSVTRVSVDTPSGMFADKPTVGISIQSDFTFTFELPKLAFLFPENSERVGEWTAESIGLSAEFIRQEPVNQHFVNAAVVKPLLKKRRKFDHKGTFGHALLAVGSLGKMGAAVLAARACLRSGAGLATVHVPRCGCEILQTAIPEAMVSLDENEAVVSAFPEDFSTYKAIGAGCGWGTNQLTVKALEHLLETAEAPLVL
ncbi:MAG: NAD(P)H-hydrate epimerase, partial [Bacteroidota bacterium]